MGKVVKLETSAKSRAGSSKTSKQRTRVRASRPSSKTALVLGGGGFTGAVYEIGALRALDLLSVNKSPNDFDVYVGTSAGSFVASLAANGITPEEMMRVVDHSASSPFPQIDVGTLLRPNIKEAIAKGSLLPLRAAGLLYSFFRQAGQISAMDMIVGAAQAMPSATYSGAGIERYINEMLSRPGMTNDFRMLESELYLVAADLDTCERIVFGANDWDDVPISSAVQASTALPMIYTPVTLKERELVDGGVVSTTNLDIAVEAGAKFIIVVNPLVPYVNDFTKRIPTLFGSRSRHISDLGFLQIGFQSFKMLAHQRLHEMARHWEERYPGVDILLIEPAPDDELMFRTSILNFTSRVAIAQHGFQSVTMKLANDYDHYKEICERHGIEISQTRVRKVIKHFAAEREKTRAWRRILEQTTGALLRQSANS